MREQAPRGPAPPCPCAAAAVTLATAAAALFSWVLLHTPRQGRQPPPRAEPRGLLLALGILSAAGPATTKTPGASVAGAAELRTAWRGLLAGAAAVRSGEVAARFVLCRRAGPFTAYPPAVVAAAEAEAARHGDIAFVDSYDYSESITLCSKVLAWLRWALQRLPGAFYFAKTDDDTLIALPRLLLHLRALRAAQPSRRVYFGSGFFAAAAGGPPGAELAPCGGYLRGGGPGPRAALADLRRRGTQCDRLYGAPNALPAGADAADCARRCRAAAGDNATATGPFYYAAGMLWLVDAQLAGWLGGAYPALFNDRVRHSSRPRIKGTMVSEDVCVGMGVHLSPFAEEVRPIFWGFEYMHDIASKRASGSGRAGRPYASYGRVTNLSVVVHKLRPAAKWHRAFGEMRSQCPPGSLCEKALLPCVLPGRCPW